MKKYQEITSRYMRVQKKRTLLTVFGIILSVALITGIGTILLSMQDKMLRDEIRDSGSYHIKFENLTIEQVGKLKQHTLVDEAYVEREEGFTIIEALEENGIDTQPPYRYLKVIAYENLDKMPIRLKDGRFPESQNEIIMDYWIKEYWDDIELGKRITLGLGQRLNPEEGLPLKENFIYENEVYELREDRVYTIVGFVETRFFSSQNYFLKAYSGYNKNEKDEVLSIFVELKSIKDIHKQGKLIAEQLDIESNQIVFNEKVLRLIGQSLNQALNTSMISIVAFIVIIVMISTVAVIYNAFHISILERIQQFGVLRCVGATPNQIKQIVFKEALILSSFGIPLGLLSGLLGMKVVFFTINKYISDVMIGDLRVIISFPMLAISGMLGLVTVLLSAYGPARQAAKISPLEAVKNTRQIRKEKYNKIKKYKFIGFIFGVEGSLAIKNMRRNRKRFIITVFSMVISIVLYIVFGSLMDFANKAGIMDSDISDFQIYKQNRSSFNDKEYQGFAEVEGVEKVYKRMSKEIEVFVEENKLHTRFKELRPWQLEEKFNEKIRLYNSQLISFGNDAFDSMELVSGSINQSLMNENNGVIVVQDSKFYAENKQVTLDIVNLKVGDEIEFVLDYYNPHGQEVPSILKVKVVGIVKEGIQGEAYNYNGGLNLITTEEVFEKLTGSREFPLLMIKVKENADLGPIREYIKGTGFSYADLAAQAAENRRTNIAISIFFYGFVAVIALIGCLNIINTISTNLILRTREFAMIKAIGITDFGIKKMILYESLYYGGVASVYGGIIGSLLSYVLYNLIVPVREFTWSIPWDKILVAIIGATCVAILSAYIPLKRINKRVIIENLRLEE